MKLIKIILIVALVVIILWWLRDLSIVHPIKACAIVGILTVYSEIKFNNSIDKK